MLLDDSPNSSMWPTGANMRAHMQRLVGGAQPGDSLIFHFSGGCPSSDFPKHGWTTEIFAIEEACDQQEIK